MTDVLGLEVSPVAIQGAGHTLKIQATDFGDVLASLAKLFVAFQQGVGARIFVLQPVQLFADSVASHRASLGERPPLLPGS
jgi:hypothetical protein